MDRRLGSAEPLPEGRVLIRTTCPYCGVGCGVLAAPDGTVRGDPDHPANRGRLCSKGTALGETLGLEGRLLHPMVGGKRASWDAALDAVAEGFRRALDRLGPEGVALYVSGQLLTEDYYAANKLAKGFLGTGNIDSNSRLCMASAVAAHRRSFGEDIVPGVYEDLELADLVVLVGSNLAWCHPVLFQRLMAAKAARPGMRVVVVDPRRTATCEGADLHLPLRPGSDVALFRALLRHLRAQEWDAAETGLERPIIARFFSDFTATQKVVTLWSQGVNQSSAGTDKANAILDVHIETGRIGRPGMGPFSVTGQPNAMGGREVGALANMLAGHLEWTDSPALAQFWGAPRMTAGPGLKAIEMFRAAENGTIGALWVMATNPAMSLPDSQSVRRGLSRIPALVVSDCHAGTDTQGFAHVLLPALGWGEKDGTVTNSERVISRQRTFRPAPGEARPDWWAVAQVAQRLGWGDAFAWDGPAAIFREHASVTTLARPAQRLFDLGGLAAVSDAAYATMTPVQWPVPAAAPSGGRLLPPVQRMVEPEFRPPAHAGSLVLLTGRLRDQWHSMTRTGRVPRLMAHAPEPLLTAHPDDVIGLEPGGLVEVRSEWGSAVLRLAGDARLPRGACFAPMHWTDELAPHARINAAVNPDADPVSGQPELKHTPVSLHPFVAASHGFVLARRNLGSRLAPWCAVAPCSHGAWRHEVAGATPESLAAALALGEPTLRLDAPDAGEHRAAWISDGRLMAVVMLGATPDVPPRDWLLSLFGEARIGSEARRALLLGALPDGPPPSPIVCICNGVSKDHICSAIVAGARDVAAIGHACTAGTGCGSCKPELEALLTEALEPV
ncbi:nitrate reductase [Sabulicella rubraurantiaca]|uniref:nitrate reductase n=1 Tax=Sabulicella rubraurantiaca TaxID=2811429 RepID=UPI001A95FC51|nr:molybdopterin-dependent oxidoreductase [Sabulicella rubraurantiaca]